MITSNVNFDYYKYLIKRILELNFYFYNIEALNEWIKVGGVEKIRFYICIK